MRVVNGIIGCVLLALGILHIFIPKTPILTAIYFGGALLALASLRPNIGFGWARALACTTVIAMFFTSQPSSELSTIFTSSGIAVA